MNERIANKIKALHAQAKKLPKRDVKVTLTSGGQNSLAKVLNTKEKADEFMRRLKALG